MDIRDERETPLARLAAPRAALETEASERDQAGVARAMANPATASHASLLDLQRLAGNAVVSRLIARSEDDDPEVGGRSPVLDVVGKGGGRPLEPGLRAEMEARLGSDFSDVRLHTDSEASQSADAVGAHAYTVGSDVVFRSDRWNPDSSEGKTTLAHELTHVIQQSTGPVSGTTTGDGIRVSNPSDPFERAAEANARSAMVASVPATPAGAAVGAQREAIPGEEDLEDEEEVGAEKRRQAVQGDFVQREETPEEEEEQETAQGDFVQREETPEQEEEEET